MIQGLLDDHEWSTYDSFFHQAAPKPHLNQKAILMLMGELVRKDRRLLYVNWGCGLGKTTCMLELGHVLGLAALGPHRKKEIAVQLVVANDDLVAYYEELFAKKQCLKDPRITFYWLSMSTFKQQLLEKPS